MIEQQFLTYQEYADAPEGQQNVGNKEDPGDTSLLAQDQEDSQQHQQRCVGEEQMIDGPGKHT
jgi:hypothetical protein